jgi:hypothetical protein
MAFTVLMTVEGVLSDDTFGFPATPPLPQGLLLFHGLSSQFMVVLSSTHTDHEAVRRWLQYSAGLKPTQWARILLANEDEDELEVRKRHLTFCLSSGMDLRYLVTPDPRLAVHSIQAGITPLCCPHPAYSRASFLPDAGQGRIAWDEIEAEVMVGRLTRQDDARLEVDDTPLEQQERLD